MNELQVDVIPADQLVAATGTLLTGLATSVASILSSDHASSSSSIEVSSLFVDTDGRLALRGRRVDIDTAERVGEAQNRFPELLQLYLDLRDTSLRLFDSLQGQGTGEAEMGQGFSELRWSLRSVFPGPFANTIKAIQALDALPSPQVGALTARLLTSQILPSSTDGTPSPIYILNQREGMELVFVLARTLIFNSAVFDEKLLADLRESTLASVLEQCEKIRTLLENKNYRQLATFIDDSLDKYIDKPDSNQTAKISLIAAMTALVKDPTCTKALKAQLKKIDRLPELCYNLVENLGKVFTPLSRLIEESRALISKNLSHNLDDYLGQKAIKERLKSTLENNLIILDRLDKFPNVPPKMAIINGFLLLGLPGGGKTYLVKCLANHFGLPLIKISREEMLKALKVVDEASQKSQSFGGFLEEKIAEVRKQMKFTKARSGLIFFDEMDSNFLKRDPAMSSQAELEETNQMLRILESVMEKNPDLLFMAATNNPHIVDPAARRVGRFGIHIELKATTKEDADELIRGACELLDISFNAIDKATSYQNLLQSCCGMVPYSLHNAVINAYISCEDPPKDGEGLVKLFLSSIESMKIYTTLDGNQKDGAGAS
jgi:AAA+ superfamily predicted ATPase